VALRTVWNGHYYKRQERKQMTTEEETIIYDALYAITTNAPALATLIKDFGSNEEAKAYRDGMYSSAIKLQVVLGTDGIARGKARYAQRDAECRAYFQTQKKEDIK
jgi:hypothetical protein